MPRYRLTIEYHGAGLVGWQRQENGASVQGAIEAAIGKFCNEKITVHGAGRTDAGVHAAGQVAHFDLAREAPADTVRDALNAHLRPAAISVLAAEIAPKDFNARYDAIARHYRYRILNRRAPPALERGRVWHVGTPLDAGAMHEAGQIFVGKHDFSSFRASECQAKSPVKTLDALTVSRLGEEIEIAVRARSFLHHQVRNFAGTLRLIGEGKWTKGDLAAALSARDRARGGPTAPAEGLCLIAIDYP
ncbi:MAG: tRNA pseudouridine(38-40) synthase TruA [Alphaproteobacteria bacterium]